MGNWIDFAAIKRAVPLAAVLEHYRIHTLRRSGQNQLRGRCPLHGGEGRETFHVNTAEQVFHCFSCGAGGSVLDLVAAVEGCGLSEAARKLSAWSVPDQVARLQKTTVTKKIKFVPALKFRLWGVDVRHPYLASRGIREVTAREFGIGFYAGPGLMSQRLVIPLDDEVGRLVGYAGRSLNGSEPRYRFPVGFAKSQVLFNLHRASAIGQPTVIVVEGFFDCLKVYQAGFGSVVALMGVALYEHQRRLLIQHFRKVILMLDGDAAGHRASAAISASLAADCAVRIVTLAENTQPDQLPEQILQELLVRKGGQPSLTSRC
jgi:DNA primase